MKTPCYYGISRAFQFVSTAVFTTAAVNLRQVRLSETSEKCRSKVSQILCYFEQSSGTLSTTNTHGHNTVLLLAALKLTQNNACST